MENFKSFGRKITVPFLQGYTDITGRKSSLSEFDSLLAHARISAEGYNLVQQGDVQKIVSMSSIERRRILDNIAGITKFDDDIAQAEGKRRETEENLERIRIILDEIDKQIRQLEADREGALKYKELNGRMSTAKAQLAYKNRELIERQIVGTKEQIAKHEADKAKLESQKAELRTLFDAAVARLNELEQEMAERGGEEAKHLKEKLDGLRIERARATDGIETSKEVLKQLRIETGEANRDQAKIQKETDALAREREKVDAHVHERDGQEPPETPGGISREAIGGSEARKRAGRAPNGDPQPHPAVRPAEGRGGRRGEHEAGLHVRGLRDPRMPRDRFDQGHPRHRRTARPRRVAVRDGDRHRGGRPHAGDHRRRRHGRGAMHRLPEETEDRARDVLASHQDARREAPGQGDPCREGVPGLRDRPLPFRREVPGRVLLRLRRHARRPDARRSPEVDGRRAARHDRGRADRSLRRDDRRRHGAVHRQVRTERRERDGEDRRETARGAGPRRDRREPPQ